MKYGRANLKVGTLGFSSARSQSFADYVLSMEPEYLGGSAPPLHLFMTFPQVDLSRISDVAASAGVSVSVKQASGNLYDLAVRLRKRAAYAKLVAYDETWTIVVRSEESPVAAGEIVEKWLANVHPKLISSFFDSKQLLDVVDSFRKLPNPPEINVSEFVLREYPKGPTHKTWEKGKPYDRSVIERHILDNNAPLDSIKFKISAERDSFDCRISRNGHLVLYAGSISQFMSLIVSPMTDIAKANQDFFRNRQREFLEGKIVLKEIRLAADEKEVATEHLERLGGAICDAFVGAILHSGNPMLYVNAIDKLDGSVFDVCAYPDEIIVMPYSKASPSSLIRLYMLITEVVPSAQRRD